LPETRRNLIGYEKFWSRFSIRVPRRLPNYREKILYVDMDNVLVDFRSGIAQLETVREFDGHFRRSGNIRSDAAGPRRCRIIRNACTAFRHLCLIDLAVANPSAWSDKLEWVKKYLGTHAYKRLILTHHKNLSIGDYLIDDRTTRDADRFVGELIHFGSERFPNWKAIVEYLLTQKS
jgi:5'-nucleotidase